MTLRVAKRIIWQLPLIACGALRLWPRVVKDGNIVTWINEKFSIIVWGLLGFGPGCLRIANRITGKPSIISFLGLVGLGPGG